jgi:hypothetical protein
VQARLLPFAVVGFLLYSIGFPLYILTIFILNWGKIKEDQLLRAGDIGNDRQTNPNAYDIRKKYHKLYYHFKPGKAYWIVYIIARKFGIAFAGLMFRGNPGFQLSVVMFILFLAFWLQAKHHPYMSSSEKNAVLLNHEAKAEEGDLYHMLVRERLRKAVQRTKTLKRTATKLNFANFAEKHGSSQLATKDYFWDFNTVEMILLASSVLVCLAGIMFESDRFHTRADLVYQRDIITVAVFAVIILSCVYYSLVFITEVFHTTPKCIKKLMIRKRIQDRTKRIQSSFKRFQNNLPSGDIEMSMNPLNSAAKQQQKAHVESEVEEYKRKLEELEKSSTRVLGRANNSSVHIDLNDNISASQVAVEMQPKAGKEKWRKTNRKRYSISAKSPLVTAPNDKLAIQKNPLVGAIPAAAAQTGTTALQWKKKPLYSEHLDKKSGRKYYMDLKTKKTLWKLPEGVDRSQIMTKKRRKKVRKVQK